MYQYLLQLITVFILLLNPVQNSYQYIPEDSLTVFDRPDSLSQVFAVIVPADTIFLEVKTKDNWFGFDPGIAQAANTGSFRYRWITTGSLLSDSTGLPSVWAPECSISYAMTQISTPVFSSTDSMSSPVAVIPSNSAAAITDSTETWLKVNLDNSPLQKNIQGWILRETVSIN